MAESPSSTAHQQDSERALTSSPAWVRWVLPSFRDLIFLSIFLSLTFGILAPRLFRDGGTGWHLRTGQIILRSHAIPRTDPFSISTAGHTWYAWEWLADAAMGAAFDWAALYGVSVLAALIIAFTFTLLFTTLRRRGTGLFLSVLLVLAAFSASTIHMFARPHVASWLLMLVWLHILESARKTGNYRRLYWLPGLMVVWVNLHGGFLMGLALLIIYWFEATWLPQFVDVSDRQPWSRSLGLVLAASVFTTFLNPYGFRLHVHIYRYLTDSFLMNHIQEFQSTNFHGAAERCFLALLVAAVFGLAVTRYRMAPREILILLFAIYTGLYASRNLPTSSILIAFLIGPLWSRVLRDRERDLLDSTLLGRVLDLDTRVGQTDSTLRPGAWIFVAIVITVWSASRGGSLGPLQMQGQFEASRFPVAAVDFLMSQGSPAPVFSTDQWGGYLVFRLYPTKVMVDDRHDLYGTPFFKGYLKIVRVQPGWNRELESMNVSSVLVPSDSSLAGALESAGGWQTVYQDDTAVLFKHAPSAQP